MSNALVGEALQVKGAEGARKAKRWLEGTSRAVVEWVNPDKGAAGKMTGKWPYGSHTFSFDLFGYLRHGDLHGKMFFAEVKNYAGDSGLAKEYEVYLAKCYVMLDQKPDFSDHFMWISWAPHGVTKWAALTSATEVQTAVIAQRKRIFGPDVSKDDAKSLVDTKRCKEVSDRLWLIILSEKQLQLVLSADHLAVIRAHETRSENLS